MRMTGRARPRPKASPISRPRPVEPAMKLRPASAQTAKASTNVVKPRPRSKPKSPLASASGIVQRQRSGTWRRIWGAICRPRQSATAAPSTNTAASASCRSPPCRGIRLPASASPPNVSAPPSTAPAAKVAHAVVVTPRRSSPSPVPIVSSIEKPHGDHAPATPATSAVSAAGIATALSRGSSSRSTARRRHGGRGSSSPPAPRRR